MNTATLPEVARKKSARTPTTSPKAAATASAGDRPTQVESELAGQLHAPEEAFVIDFLRQRGFAKPFSLSYFDDEQKVTGRRGFEHAARSPQSPLYHHWETRKWADLQTYFEEM